MMEAPGGGEAVAIEPAQGLAPGVALRGMPSAVANAVFASAARRKGEGGARSELTERELAVLALVFDAKKLTQAFKLLETPGALVRHVGARSRRWVYAARGGKAWTHVADGAQEMYLCWPGHYCGCQSFFYNVVSKGDAPMCKHQLAAAIADATGAAESVEVEDQELACMLAQI